MLSSISQFVCAGHLIDAQVDFKLSDHDREIFGHNGLSGKCHVAEAIRGRIIQLIMVSHFASNINYYLLIFR